MKTHTDKTKYYHLITFIFWAIGMLFFASCSPVVHDAQKKINIVFEDNELIFFYNQVYSPYQGDDLVIDIGVKKGNRIDSLSYSNYSLSGKLSESPSYDYYQITLHDVYYPEKIKIITCRNYITHYYADNELKFTITETSPHLNSNTLTYNDIFQKEGKIACHLNFLSISGDKITVPFGGRFDRKNQEIADLYVEYFPTDNEKYFTYELENKSLTITAVKKEALSDKILAIPEKINGYQVKKIASDIVDNQMLDILILPPSIKEVAPNAFTNCTIDSLIMYDDIEVISNASFNNSSITTLTLNAIQLPAYQQKYFATFADKMDYLAKNKNQKKILFVCGSSARFGYDSSAFKEAFPEYEIINMGVYAYSNMLPLIRSMKSYINLGDIVISSPEFDSIEKQFCSNNAFDNDTFCLYEANYSLLSELTLKDYTNVFDSFQVFQEHRKNLPRFAYEETPNNYDEDGQKINGSSYNIYGDYVVYRPSNDAKKTFGIKRAYFNKKYFNANTIDNLNKIYNELKEQGASVFFVYSPRSNISISSDSDNTTIQELDSYLNTKLSIPIITDINSALIDPYYFYGTDNHLSTEGVKIYSKLVIDALKPYLQ